MKIVRVLLLLGTSLSLAGCIITSSGPKDEVVVQASASVAAESPREDKSGAFFLRRSLLCRKLFTDALTNLVAQTGHDEDNLLGATISRIDEGYTNGVYTLRLDVAWSAAREIAAGRILSVTNAASVTGYVPSVDESKSLSAFIGPKQIRDEDGKIHFLGISAMAIGHNAVLSKQNIRRAELDAQAMAVCAFLGKGRKMTDVKAEFRQVFAVRSRHPLSPGREMYACGYEVVSLERPVR